MAENLPNLAKYIHFQEIEQTPNRNSKNFTSQFHSQISETKGKEKNLMNSKRQMITYLQEENSSNDRECLIGNSEGL